MSIIRAIKEAEKNYKARNWDTIYWAIDLHGTISKFNYSNDDLTIKFYDYAKGVLLFLTSVPNYKLILFTCSYKENIDKILVQFKKNGINFDYVNENPEAKNTEYGDYSKKPYFNILLEDKAGFDPEEDWKLIFRYFFPNNGANNENPLKSVCGCMSSKPHDWSVDHRDAWMYSVALGTWEDNEDGCFDEIAKKHQWSSEEIKRLKRLRKRWKKIEEEWLW